MDTVLSISSDTLGPAFKAWADYQAETRGKSTLRIAQDAAQYVISAAMKEIEERRPGSVAKVERDLMALSHETNSIGLSARARKRGGAAGSKYRNTMAARLVFMMNYGDARLKAAFGDDAGAYAQVGKFAAARKFSVRHHKVSGFIPALTELNRARGRRAMIPREGPRYRNAPGSYQQTVTANLAEILISVWPTAAPRPGRPAPLGLPGMVPDAFSARLPGVQAQFLKFCLEDGILTAAAGKAGLKVLTFNTGAFGS